MSWRVVAELKSQIPECKIGFIVLKQSKIVLEAFSAVDWIHEGEYWFKPNRNAFQRFVDLFRFIFIEQRRLVKQIKAVGYDCAIELRPFFPNMTSVFWKSKIPLRIGFLFGANAKLLNVPVSWSQDQYLAYSYWDLFEKIGVVKDKSQFFSPTTILKKNCLSSINRHYLIFHLCSSDSLKELSSDFWRSLHQKCREKGHEIYFTGQGEREEQIISKVVDDPHYNLCNKLKWAEFLELVIQSRGVVSVDSVPVHIAAVFNIPCAVLFRDTPFPKLWKPNVDSCSAFGIESPVQIEEVLRLIEQWEASKIDS